MEEITYRKQNYEVEFRPKGRGMLPGKFFELTGLNLGTSLGGNLGVGTTYSEHSGYEHSAKYNVNLAKRHFDHFNQDLLNKVVEEKQLRNLL